MSEQTSILRELKHSSVMGKNCGTVKAWLVWKMYNIVGFKYSEKWYREPPCCPSAHWI